MKVYDFVKTYCKDVKRFEIHYLNNARQNDTASDDRGMEDTLELLEYLGLEDNEISSINTISYGQEDYLVITLCNY